MMEGLRANVMSLRKTECLESQRRLLSIYELTASAICCCYRVTVSTDFCICHQYKNILQIYIKSELNQYSNILEHPKMI